VTIIVLIGIGFALLFKSLEPKPYKQYPNSFQQRGMQKAMDDYTPKTRADSLYAIEMLILQKSDERKYNDSNSKPDLGTLLGGIGAILLGLGGIGKVFYDSFGVRSDKRHTEIIDRFNGVDDKFEKNEEQHLQIFDDMKIVYDTKAKEAVADALRHIAEKHIYFKRKYISENMCLLINSQTQRLIELSDEIMTPNFTLESLALTEIKIEERNRQSWRQVAELFGCDFLVKYKISQKISVDKFKSNLKDLADKKITNSKYDQYRAIAELFLHDIIENTLLQYDIFVKEHKINI
jgi:hypothetical protein